MDWTTIITTVISCGCVFTLYETIRYRKENKSIKGAEATNADTEAQEKKMDLAEMYLQKVMALTESNNEKVASFAQMSNDNQAKILTKLDSLDERTDAQEMQLRNIEAYLNGNYHKWLADQEKGELENV